MVYFWFQGLRGREDSAYVPCSLPRRCSSADHQAAILYSVSALCFEDRSRLSSRPRSHRSKHEAQTSQFLPGFETGSITSRCAFRIEPHLPASPIVQATSCAPFGTPGRSALVPALNSPPRGSPSRGMYLVGRSQRILPRNLAPQLPLPGWGPRQSCHIDVMLVFPPTFRTRPQPNVIVPRKAIPGKRSLSLGKSGSHGRCDGDRRAAEGSRRPSSGRASRYRFSAEASSGCDLQHASDGTGGTPLPRRGEKKKVRGRGCALPHSVTGELGNEVTAPC